VSYRRKNDVKCYLNHINNGFCLINKETGKLDFSSRDLDFEISPNLTYSEFCKSDVFKNRINLEFYNSPINKGVSCTTRSDLDGYHIYFFDDKLEMAFEGMLKFSDDKLVRFDLVLSFNEDRELPTDCSKSYFLLMNCIEIDEFKRSEHCIYNWGSFQVSFDHWCSMPSIIIKYYKPSSFIWYLKKLLGIKQKRGC
jgi:hypothetical protein